jgi:hypothetical protein
VATLADLELVIGPPSVVPPSVNWIELEKLSGLRFPSSYRAFAERYGMLEIGAFLDVHHVGIPADLSMMLDLRRQALEPLRELMDDLGYIYLEDDSGDEIEAAPYPLYPEPAGLFPWGTTQNGHTLLWLTDKDPGKWTTVITDGGSWWHFDGCLVDFLVGILSQTVRCPLFPNSFPSSPRFFQYSSLNQLPH